MTPDLSVTLGPVRFKNPVMVASGTFGYAEEFKGFFGIKKLGAVVSKTITLRPRAGNPPPRTCETPAGLLNSIGLENPGVDVFIKEKLPVLLECGAPVIVSVSSEADPREFVDVIDKLEAFDIAGIEMNISCPNVKHAGTTALIAQDPQATRDAVSLARARTRKLLITKLSPAVASIADIALAAQDGGADAVSLINTIPGMRIDIHSRRPVIASGTGGLSGPAIRPVAVRMVWEVFQKVRVPIIGMGGICDYSSALEFIIAGATAISVGTANFTNPRVSMDILNGLRAYARGKKIASVKDLIGTLAHDKSDT